MRFPTALVAFTFVVAPLPFARPAHATDCSGVLSPCIDDDILWPHAGPAQFVAVGSTDTVGEGRLGFGLVSTYLSRPVVIHVPAPGDGGTDAFAADNVVDGTFLWSYGLSDRLQLDLALPLAFYQQGAGLSPITGGPGLNDTATRDLRFGFAFTLVRRGATAAAAESSDGFGLAGRLEVSAPSGDRNELSAEGYGTFVPSVAADFRQGQVFAGLEVGARLRPTVDLLGAEVGSQIVTALGVGYDILPRSLLSLALEGWALPTLSEQKDLLVTGGLYSATPNGSHITPAEWHMSARTAPLRGGDLSLELGGGGAMPISGDVVTQPRFRFTLGVRWAPAGPVQPAALRAPPSP